LEEKFICAVCRKGLGTREADDGCIFPGGHVWQRVAACERCGYVAPLFPAPVGLGDATLCFRCVRVAEAEAKGVRVVWVEPREAVNSPFDYAREYGLAVFVDPPYLSYKDALCLDDDAYPALWACLWQEAAGDDQEAAERARFYQEFEEVLLVAPLSYDPGQFLKSAHTVTAYLPRIAKGEAR